MDKGNILEKYMPVRMIKNAYANYVVQKSHSYKTTPSEIRSDLIRGMASLEGDNKVVF